MGGSGLYVDAIFIPEKISARGEAESDESATRVRFKKTVLTRESALLDVPTTDV